MPCSQVQLARVVVCVLVLVDVVCVMIVVLIAHVDVVHAVDTVFVAIFQSWRCTLYTCQVSRFMCTVLVLVVTSSLAFDVLSLCFTTRT